MITTENHLLDILVHEFSHTTINKDYVKRLFQESKQRQTWFSDILKRVFNKLGSDPDHHVYSNSWFYRPWPSSKYYEALGLLFQYLPSGNLELIMYLNETFIPIIKETWPYIVAANSDNVQHPYYETPLSGTSVEAHLKTEQQLDGHMVRLEHMLKQAGANIFKRYKGLRMSPGWQNRPESLFPVGYLPGSQGYGRLSSIPGSTLSNSKGNFKDRVLKQIGRDVGLDFFELDLKGCHLSIFRDLYDFSNQPDERGLLPPSENLWPALLAQFKQIHDAMKSANETLGWVLDRVDFWLDQPKSPMIKLLKNQTYKSLNGGDPYKCVDNVRNSKYTLDISDEQVGPISDYLQVVFSQLGMFKLLVKFMAQINGKPYLYLPNSQKPFVTNTLSRKQTAYMFQNLAQLSQQGAMLRGNTSNSRLFSSVEFCLILHVLESIEEAGLPWLVMSYEQDGLLVAVEPGQDREKMANDLAFLNRVFLKNIKLLTYGEHLLEIK